jgi:hypothetical protein
MFIEFLFSRARSQTIRSAVLRAKEELARSDLVTLDKTLGLLDDCYLSQRFRAVAKLLYCTVGARAAKSEAIIPAGLWRAAGFPEASSRVSLSASSRQIAHVALMDYFVIKASAIDGLSASAILDLKAEPMTARCIRELDQAVEEIAAQDSTAADLQDLSRLANDRAKIIQDAVFSKCRKEEKHLKVEAWVFGATDEAGSTLGNLVGVGPIKKGLASIARRLARKTEKLSWLDYTSAPLVTYVSRYRQFIAKHRTA